MQIKHSSRITPCLWFDHQGETAAEFYVSVFKNSRITQIARYGDAGKEIHGRPAGSVMTVAFELDGHPFTALNGGPHFKFNEAISLQVNCETQAEVDHYWDKLSAGGDPNAQQCGWVKDRYGLSWQIVPYAMNRLLADPDEGVRKRVFNAMMEMKRLNIAAIEAAAKG